MHLAPDHESSLAEILQAHAAIPVRQVNGRMLIEADHVYVIPPNKNLVVSDGHLDLTEFDEPRGKRAPIDVFFRTLADVHPDGTAVLLSGMGTDGAVGMKAVKEQGGILMAQMPEEAEHDSMPRSAIATGLVDFVLSAPELARKVVELYQRGVPVPLAQPEALPEDDEAALQRVLAQVRARLGHDFSGYKRSTILRRVGRRMRVCGAESLAAYLDVIRASAAEAEALLKDLLISVTNFFRDPDAFEALGREVIPELVEKSSEVRAWVPGCATGEEAYSLGMLLLEEAGRQKKSLKIQIFASDLDEDALAFAREGLYPEVIVADVSEERLRRFFVRTGAYYRVSKELRETVLFTPHGLLTDPPFSQLDLISCRNLLIYLKRDLQEKVFGLFHYALRPDGYLFLGTSESADVASAHFRSVDKGHRIYQRERGPVGVVEHLPDLPLSTVPRGHRVPGRPADPRYKGAASEAEQHRLALEAHAPPSLLVDWNHDIVHVSESAGRYLQFPSGTPSPNVIKAVREELRVDLRTALFEAIEKGEPTISYPVSVQIEGERRTVQLYVRPVTAAAPDPARPPTDERAADCALIVFVEAAAVSSARASAEEVGGNGSAPAAELQIHRLEEELQKVKGRQHASAESAETQREELKASNEELQSINEEYKSTLEELETSKEELQSINEELKTVNEELKGKVDLLARANDDLGNLMAATDVATLFLDRELRVKRFTPPLTRLFNVMPVDQGRPLDHLTHRLTYEGLGTDAERVLETLIPVERQVQDDEGRHYLLRILPYRTTEDRIEGVVLTFVDVTRLREAREELRQGEELRQSEERYRLLVEGVQEYAIFQTDPEGQITTWNVGAERILRYTREEALGKPVAVIFTEEDRAAGAPEAELATARREGYSLDERWHVRADGSRFWGSGVMTALYDRDGVLRGFAKVMRDNTERKAHEEALREGRERLQDLNASLEARVKEQTAKMRELALALTLAEQKERRRISQILHDDVQQLLFGVQLKIQLLRDTAGAALEGANKRARREMAVEAENIVRLLSEAIGTTRRLTVDLSPPVLQGEGLADTLQWVAGHAQEMYGLEVTLEAHDPCRVADENVRVLLFQIVRELLFNVVKHAGTGQVQVTLARADGRCVIEVADDGKGFDPEAVAVAHAEGRGFGLHSAQERLRLIGGEIQIHTAPGDGTRIVIAAPFDGAA